MLVCARVSVSLLALALLLTGCGTSDTSADTFPVSGTVNVDGEPLASGRIFFEDPSKAISNGADITNGSYSGKAAAGDLKARVVKTEKQKDPMGGDDIDKETPLPGSFPVSVKKGDNKFQPFEVKTKN